jgi:hypothetical protein
MILPYEIREKIIDYLPFEKTLDYNYIFKQKYNPKIHTFKWAAENGHLEVIE